MILRYIKNVYTDRELCRKDNFIKMVVCKVNKILILSWNIVYFIKEQKW